MARSESAACGGDGPRAESLIYPDWGIPSGKWMFFYIFDSHVLAYKDVCTGESQIAWAQHAHFWPCLHV